MEKKKIEVINFVPCRLSEPFSAIALNDKMLMFGAITGYIGFIMLANKGEEATYIDEVFD